MKTTLSNIGRRSAEHMKTRHYHNLRHLEALYRLLREVKSEIHDWPAIVYSITYHDFIYKASSNTNEFESAELAKDRLSSLGVTKETVDKVVTVILSTRDHKPSPDPDCNFFLDADLSILGSTSAEYLEYAANVRKEFSFVPAFMYRAGRKKVLKKFLERGQIFKTDVFRERFETQARKNIIEEIETL